MTVAPAPGHGEHGDRRADPLPGALPADGAARPGAALLARRGPGERDGGEPGALQQGGGRLRRAEQDGQRDHDGGRRRGRGGERGAAGERVPGHAGEQAEQVGQHEQPRGAADRPRGGQQLLPAGDRRACDRAEHRQADRAGLPDDAAEEQERQDARRDHGEQRQPRPLAGVAEQQAERHPGRAGREVAVAAVGGAEADDADHGQRGEHRARRSARRGSGTTPRADPPRPPRCPRGRHGQRGHVTRSPRSAGPAGR